jgi:hypothetical protein
MPVDLRDIASISGMPGLYRIVSPTRSGVIIETVAENPVRSVAQAKHRISLLHEISIYTNDPDVTVPLSEIFDNARASYGETAPVNAKSSNPELISFMETVLPDYDRDRVYISDMKKIATWYNLVSKTIPFTEAEAEETTEEAETETTEASEKKEKAPAKKTKKSAE